jgi:HlyD family secretion protein
MNEHTPSPESDFARRLGLDRPRRRFWTWRKVLLVAVIALGLAGGVSYYLGYKDGAPIYVTAGVSRGPLTVTVSATGTLQPDNQVDVGAEISGRVDQVLVDYNSRVAKGQVLAVINTDQLRAQLAQSEAALNAAKANVMTSEATAKETGEKQDRARALVMRGLVSVQELQTAEADYDRAVAAIAKSKADVENAMAQVSVFQTSLSKAEIRSPIAGVVLDRRVEMGQTVAASFQTPVLFTLASDLSMMQLQVDIDEADIGLVREGQPAMFSVDAFPQRRFDAELVSLRNAPKTTNGVVTYQGVLSVDNATGLLRPGLTATVDILVAESKDTLMVPNGALRFTPPQKLAKAPPLAAATNGQVVGRVWVLAGEKLEARDLKLGHSDGRNTEVLGGQLAPGERVVTDLTDAGRAGRANGG